MGRNCSRSSFCFARGFAAVGIGSVIADADASPVHTRPSWRRGFRVLLVCLFLWWIPVLLAGILLGWHSTLVQEGCFFSKAAMVTFGGAYAVLPYVAQQGVS